MATRLEDLTDMRTLLWESIRASDPDKRAALFARLESVVNQLAVLDSAKPKAGDPVDEIAERRAARGAGSAKSQRQASSD